MTLMLEILALIGLLVLVIAGGRALRRPRPVDGPHSVLAAATRNLPVERADWGQAMLAELDRVDGGAPRWRFALGGVRAAWWARLPVRLTARPALMALLALAVSCEGLALAAAIVYPDLRGDRLLAPVLAVLTVVLAGYAGVAMALRRGTAGATTGRLAASTGLVLGVAWFVFAVAWWNLHGAPLFVVLLLPLGLGLVAGRRGRGLRAGVGAVIWAALIGGLVTFVGLIVDAYLTAGGPYDQGQLDEFAHSGAPNLAAYWMGEGLASSLELLVAVPMLTVLVGSFGALLGAALRHRPAPEATGR